jgi:hypothetical protein
VVGESQSEIVLGKLASLWRPGVRRLDHLEPADEQVIDRVWGGRRGKAEALAQLVEHGGALGRPQIEIAAEQQW